MRKSARTKVFIIKLKIYFGCKKMNTNSLKEIRESFLISKAELAKMANISVLTLTRIEHGKPCRLETKRKILMALGLRLSDRNKVFH
jgi:DNA-binding XRE family transcriptional regulator